MSERAMIKTNSLRQRHQVGRHLLTFADGGQDWCRRCGTFDCYLAASCRPQPKSKRFWPQRKKTR